MYIVPEKELYTLAQLFYAGNHAELASMDLDSELDFTNALYRQQALMYQARSQFIQKDTVQAQETIAKAQQLLQEAAEADEVDAQSVAYVSKELAALEQYFQGKPVDGDSQGIGQILRYVQTGEVSPAGEDDNSSDLELVAFRSVVFGDAKSLKALQRAKEAHPDALVLDFALAWKGMSHQKHDDDENSVQQAYYFWDELCGSGSTAGDKTWTALAACQLQMGHVSEAEQCLANLAKDNESSLIAQIALASQRGDSGLRADLMEKLSKQYPQSAYLADINAKNELFDGIVASY